MTALPDWLPAHLVAARPSLNPADHLDEHGNILPGHAAAYYIALGAS